MANRKVSGRWSRKITKVAIGIGVVLATLALIAIGLAAVFFALTSGPVFLLRWEWIWPWDGEPAAMSGAGWANAESAARQGVLLALGGILAVVGVTFTWLRHRREELLSKLEADRHWTHRYTDAVAQLGSDTMAIQMGGIYALERLTQDAPTNSDRQTIAEVFAAYLREYASIPTTANFDEDGQGGLESVNRLVAEALGRIATVSLSRPLNLSHVNLSQASFAGADLQGWNFFRSWMWRSNFDSANLKGAFLPGAVVNESTFVGSNLENAVMHDTRFEGANLSKAILKGAELSRCSFRHAEMMGAQLKGTKMGGTDLSEALHLSHPQLVEIGGWDSGTFWPDNHEPSARENQPTEGAPFHY